MLSEQVINSQSVKNYLQEEMQQNFSLLRNFTCAAVKNELDKNPDMRTVAMVELENNFPHEFSNEVLKCLPIDVTKMILNPHADEETQLILPRQTMVIYVADKVEWVLMKPMLDLLKLKFLYELAERNILHVQLLLHYKFSSSAPSF